MKKPLGILLALFLVFGMAGSALAAFNFDSTFFVAYEEDDLGNPVINDRPGFENFSDLGTVPAFNTFVANLAPGDSIDTNITLDDFNTGSWGDVFVGIFGKLGPGDFTYFFSSDDPDYQFNAIGESGFSSGHTTLSNLLSPLGTSEAQLDKAATQNYKVAMQANGTNPGSYGGPILSTDNFGAEVNLAGIESGAITIGWFGGDLFNDFIDPDGDFVGQFPEIVPPIGELQVFLDASDGSLLVGQVPVPGAVWLLGSALLGLIGIRRRNAK